MPSVAWILLALPLAGLALLLARPELDRHWEHHPSHFWLVLLTAAVSVVLAYLTSTAAGRYRDARLILVSLAFLASAGFLGLHALATPGVLLAGPNVGFVIATPIGLIVAAVFAAISVSAWAGPHAGTLLRHRWRDARRPGRSRWSSGPSRPWPRCRRSTGRRRGAEALGPLRVAAVVTVAVYAFAAWRYVGLWRRRGGIVPLTVGVAFVLLAEAMVAVSLSRNWKLSWWEWHVLMLLAFAMIALGARTEYRRSGTLSAAFGGLYLDATLARVDRWHAEAIAAVAAADARGESPDRVLDHLRREGATDDDVRLLVQAARELSRLDASFRPFLPAVVARRIRTDPGPSRLGGEEREVSVLFADLAGFTTFSENRPPTEVIGMLNEFWAAVVPVVDAAGGSIEHFAGDGIMTIFNAAGDQPDHSRRAARAALATLAASRPLSTSHPDWPTFRIGINTGQAVVGNVGAADRHSFATIGDTTNTAARLMAAGEPGQIVISGSTRRGLGDEFAVKEIGPTRVKGMREAVEAWLLSGEA